MKNISTFENFKSNEKYDNDFSFTTVLKNKMTDYYFKESDFSKKYELDLENIDITFTESNFIIKWEINTDAREWGMKDININIISVIGSFSIDFYDGDLDTTETKEFELKSNDFRIDNELKLNSGSITPTEIEIDFKYKKITIL